MTESLLLASAGCLLGVLLAWRGVPAILALLPETSLPHESAVSLNLYVLAFTVITAFCTGILAGLAPAITLVRTTIHAAVQSGNRATAGGKARLPVRTLLLVSEVALTAMLLIGSAVGLQKLVALYHADLGYDPKGRCGWVDLGWLHNDKDPVENRRAFYQRIATALRTLPGVEAVAETWGGVPPTLGLVSPISVGGASKNLVTASVGLVGSEYFNTLKTPLLGGRMFSAAEVQQRANVAVVNLTFARLLAKQGLSTIGIQISAHGLIAAENEGGSFAF